MSAWVVSKHHIDLLVSAAIERQIPVKFLNIDVTETATEENANAIGKMLLAENIRSVVYRYNLAGTKEALQYERDLNAYEASRYQSVRPSAAACAANCFDYQACECPDYQDTPAAFFVRQLKAVVGDNPKGYDSEPWGFDTETQVLAATAAGAGAA